MGIDIGMGGGNGIGIGIGGAIMGGGQGEIELGPQGFGGITARTFGFAWINLGRTRV